MSYVQLTVVTGGYCRTAATRHQRGPFSASRQRFGDWEGDTVEGARGGGHIASHVERKSRYLVAAKLANKTAKAMARPLF